MNRQQLEENLQSLHQQSFAWALRCCFEHKEAAEDVLQNTYLKILEGKARYRGQSVFKTWLFSVIRYTAIDYHQHSKQQRSRLTDKDFGGHFPIMDVDDVEANTQSELFQKGLHQLSPQQQKLLHLVFYQNCTIQQAADIMEIQLGTARTHYQRGKRQLKAWLTKVGASGNVR